MNKQKLLKKILYLGPCFVVVSIFYELINSIFISYQAFCDGKVVIAIITLVLYFAFSIPVLIFEYFLLIKKSRISGLILSFLFSIFLLINIMALCAAILGDFNIILPSAGFENIGDFFNLALNILLITSFTIAHYLLYKDLKEFTEPL